LAVVANQTVKVDIWTKSSVDTRLAQWLRW